MSKDVAKSLLERLLALPWLVRTSANDMLSQLRRMPWVLRTATQASLVLGVLFPVLTFIPGAHIYIDGFDYAHVPMWEGGYAYAFWAMGISMIAIGVGIYRRSAWAKIGLVAMPVFQLGPFYLFPPVFRHQVFMSPENDVLWVCGWAVLMALYLAFSSGAKKHFSRHDGI